MIDGRYIISILKIFIYGSLHILFFTTSLYPETRHSDITVSDGKGRDNAGVQVPCKDTLNRSGDPAPESACGYDDRPSHFWRDYAAPIPNCRKGMTRMLASPVMIP